MAQKATKADIDKLREEFQGELTKLTTQVATKEEMVQVAMAQAETKKEIQTVMKRTEILE